MNAAGAELGCRHGVGGARCAKQDTLVVRQANTALPLLQSCRRGDRLGDLTGAGMRRQLWRLKMASCFKGCLVATGFFAASAVSLAFAQSPASLAVADEAVSSPWRQAKAQIETVCRGYEAAGRYALAARCYDEAAEMVAAPPSSVAVPASVNFVPRDGWSRTASPVVRTAATVAPAARRADSNSASPHRDAAVPTRRDAEVVTSRRVAPVSVSRPRSLVQVAAYRPRPVVVAEVTPRSSCTNLLCSRFVLLGIGY